VLTDSTGGLTLGTQTVAGLAVGGTRSHVSTGITTGAALGVTGRGDPQPERRQRGQQPGRSDGHRERPVTDVAVTDVSAPGAVIQGNSGHGRVTVQNVGGQNVVSSFNVVLKPTPRQA